MVEARPRPRVVVVDDSRYQRELARDVLAERAAVETCADAEEALAALARDPADLVVSDLAMPGLSGLELLARVRREHPGTDFVLVTAHASVESAVEALRMGAVDYLQKPVRASDLILLTERALARREILAENRRLRDEVVVFETCSARGPCLGRRRRPAATSCKRPTWSSRPPPVGLASAPMRGARCPARRASTRGGSARRRRIACACG